MKRSLTVLGAAVLVSVAMVGSAFAQISPQLPAPGEAPAGSPVAKHGKLKTSGKNIVGEDNNPVVLRGMSMYWAGLRPEGSGNPYFNDGVVGWLAHDWKASVVRAAIPAAKTDHMDDNNAAYRGSTNGYADGDSALMIGKAKAVVEAAIRRGMYVIVDWHSHNRHKDGSPNPNYSAKGAEFMGTMAKLYGKYPNVLFEPFNEPVANASTDEIKNYVTPMITEIRKYSENIIVVGSPSFSIRPGDIMNVVTGTNIAYSFHFYAHSHSKGSYSGNVAAVLNAGKAVLVTEFGTTDYSGAKNHNAGNANEWITYLEGEKVGWVNWSIYDFDEESMILAMQSGGTSGGPWTLKPAGTWVKGHILDKNTTAGYYPSSTYSVTASASPSEGGTVALSPAGPSYAYNATFTATATPKDGWELKKWTGDAYGSDAKIEGKIVGVNLKIGASFYNGGLIKNGHFTSGTLNWARYQNGLTDPGASASISQVDTTLGVTINSPGVVAADISVYQQGLKLNKDRRYELSFEAKAASARKMTVRVSAGRAATSATYLKYDEDLTTSMKKVTGKAFNMTAASTTDGYLVFDVGGTKSNVFITNVKLVDIGPSDGSTNVAHSAFSKPAVTSWSVSNIGGATRLNGPSEAGAALYLYDTRGKMVKSMAAVNGLSLGAGLSAGNYLLVVKNSSGAEVLRSKVVMTR